MGGCFMGRSSLSFRWLWLPYCLERLADGRYVALNRRYKFLGAAPDEFVDYEAAPEWARMRITPAQARKLADDSSAFDPARIYLYKDPTAPTANEANWDAYQARLAVLAKLKVG